MNNKSIEKSVLLIEDHPIAVKMTKWELWKIDRTLKITVCNNAQAALTELERSNHWFRIILDLDIPGAYGLTLARKFAQLGVAPKCVIFTGINNPQWQAEAKAMGMLGYIIKATEVDDLSFAFKETLCERRIFSNITMSEPTSTEPAAMHLTPRQKDVLYLLHHGHSSKSMARELGLSVGTIDNYTLTLLRTLKVSTRTQAVVKGVELGYIKFSDIPLHAPQIKRYQPQL